MHKTKSVLFGLAAFGPPLLGLIAGCTQSPAESAGADDAAESARFVLVDRESASSVENRVARFRPRLAELGGDIVEQWSTRPMLTIVLPTAAAETVRSWADVLSLTTEVELVEADPPSPP